MNAVNRNRRVEKLARARRSSASAPSKVLLDLLARLSSMNREELAEVYQWRISATQFGDQFGAQFKL